MEDTYYAKYVRGVAMAENYSYIKQERRNVEEICYPFVYI
jgi:hypothetical protein